MFKESLNNLPLDLQVKICVLIVNALRDIIPPIDDDVYIADNINSNSNNAPALIFHGLVNQIDANVEELYIPELVEQQAMIKKRSILGATEEMLKILNRYFQENVILASKIRDRKFV